MPRPDQLKTETALWDHIKPCLLGRRWTRLESRGTTSGPGDAFGFYGRTTQWVELKVGAPKFERLRASQQEFAEEANKSGVPVWACFAHRGEVKWFSVMDRSLIKTVPPFYRPDLVGRKS